MAVPAVITTRRTFDDQRWSLFLGLVVLNVVDVITTFVIIGRGGVEGNPFVKPLIDGVWQVSLLKAVVLAIIGLLLMRCEQSRISNIALSGATGWYLAVVFWNLLVLAVI